MFEKDGEVRKFRKVRLTNAGRELRAGTKMELLISDGIVKEFGGRVQTPARAKKGKAGKASGEIGKARTGKDGAVGAKNAPTTAAPLTAVEEALAARIKEWRAGEAKRLRVPAYVVLHDRTVKALAQARPANPKQLLEIDGMGPAKVEKFGEVILEHPNAGQASFLLELFPRGQSPACSRESAVLEASVQAYPGTLKIKMEEKNLFPDPARNRV